MRPLVMDFRDDTTARTMGTSTCSVRPSWSPPVTHLPGDTPVRCICPSTPGGWYLFLDGRSRCRWSQRLSPGPIRRHAGLRPRGINRALRPRPASTPGEKPADPITFYCLPPGADGIFTLYEDQGTTNDYETSAFTEIPLKWTDATKGHSASGARQGSFTGMLRFA